VGTKGLAMNDSRIFTNAPGNTLLARFKSVLADDVQFLDILVGYFRFSGFNQLYESLDKTDTIRVLVGLNIDSQSYTFIDQINDEQAAAKQFSMLSHEETRKAFKQSYDAEANNATDEGEVRQSHKLFLKMLREKKLLIKVHPERNLHAKVYIMRFRQPPRSDYGTVITGSSNFSANGFVDQYEFNVQLKDKADVEHSLRIFEELWKDGVPIEPADVEVGTGALADITPYELYLKFLAEYFRNHIDVKRSTTITQVDGQYKVLQYQIDAVHTAQQMLKSYGGVFLSDVVGLGKTYMAALLALQLDGRCLVIAPPSLLGYDNAGSWESVFGRFRVSSAKFVSLGKLDQAIQEGVADFKYVIIDESHRFRSENTQRFALLKQICQQKGVILLSATPYNNNPRDVLAQLALFQDVRASTIPGVRQLENYFYALEGRLKGLDRAKDYDQYIRIVRENASELRNKVLKYVMVRRTRNEISQFYAEDLKKQQIAFPEVTDPISLYYQMTTFENDLFDATIKMLHPSVLHYARYRSMSAAYYNGDKEKIAEQGSTNLATFMRILLVKRLESSFFAFRETLKRFITSHELMIKTFHEGYVYTSRYASNKIFDYLADGDQDAINDLIAEDRAERFPASEFDPLFLAHLQEDLDRLRDLESRWKVLSRDPKWESFSKELRTRSIDGNSLATQKLVIFTEFSDTAESLAKNLRIIEPKTLLYSSKSSPEERRKVIKNFDANDPDPQDEYRIIVTTDVLAEGVNMHRSCIVINYDLPWNPSKLMQRVGRVNRVGTKFNKLYTLNFFPSAQGDSQIALTESARVKINAFIQLLGNDARLLSEDEDIVSHQFFEDLRKGAVAPQAETQSELRYLKIILDIRDHNPTLFAHIMQLSKKILSARHSPTSAGGSAGVVSYFRQGELDRFWHNTIGAEPTEIDFFQIVALLECLPNEPKHNVDDDRFFASLMQHKQAEQLARRGADAEEVQLAGNASKINARLQVKSFRTAYLAIPAHKQLVTQIQAAIKAGRLPVTILKKVADALSKTDQYDDIIHILRRDIPQVYLRAAEGDRRLEQIGYDGVVLAEYFS
jgi:superfamily II DNA or RNA helicase